jgi:hypothetical protein
MKRKFQRRSEHESKKKILKKETEMKMGMTG